MLKLNLAPWFENADPATKEAEKKRAIEEALKTAVSEEELKREVGLLRDEARKTESKILAEVNALLSKKADKTELHTHPESALQPSSEKPKVDARKPKESPRWSKLIKSLLP